MEALRIKNLRSLEDTGSVPIKPVTLLVGTNSSGKSSFLRAFPLLRQSIETATESPILWFGRYVDFGSIAEAINYRSEDRRITFGFSFKISSHRNKTSSGDLTIALAEHGAQSTPYVESYELVLDDNKADIQFDPLGLVKRFFVNGMDILEADTRLSLTDGAFLIPTISLSKNRDQILFQPRPSSGRSNVALIPFMRPVFDLLVEDVRPLVHGNTSEETIKQIARQIWIGDLDEILDGLKQIDGGSTWKERVGALQPTSEAVKRIGNHVFAGQVPPVLQHLDEVIADFMAGVAYMGPLRTTAQRYYRVQDLAVGEVDYRGENLPMFLRSLSPEEIESFSSFTREHLGFEVVSRAEGAHVAIHLKEAGADRDINLVDLGFGYSQILPLMALLWSTCYRERRSNQAPVSVIAIEQPELHLHPAHQIKVADMLVGALLESRRAEREVRLLVETHSEAIVNRVGELIQKKKIAASDAQIVIFEQDPETRQSTVRIASYEDDGALRNWPYGFFTPIVD